MRILFLTDYWFPKKTANAVCVQNIAAELLAAGNEVYVCAYRGENDAPCEEDGIHFSYVRPSLARRLMHASGQCGQAARAKMLSKAGVLLNRIRRLLLLPFYPLVSLFFPLRWRKEAEKVIRHAEIDAVVSVIAPEEALFAGYLIKKRNPAVDWIAYYIDAGTNILAGTSFEQAKRLLQGKACRWENKVLENAGKIIVMEGHADYYRRNLSAKNREKLRVANVPLLKIPSAKAAPAAPKSSEVERWVYTGSMSGRLYDPHPLCEMFTEYRKTHAAELHLYGPSDHNDFLRGLNEQASGIVWHGSVPHEQISSILVSADLLIYYTCLDVDSVSGKMFEYLGTGKRILYLGPAGDINAGQLAKYDRGLALSLNDPVSCNIQKLEMFLRSTQNSPSVDVSALCKNYRLNLPSFTAEIILH